MLAFVPFLAGLTAEPAAQEVLFRDVRVFDGRSTRLSIPTAVVVRGNQIAAIGAAAVPTGTSPTIIDGDGRTLMPGLIDARVHDQAHGGRRSRRACAASTTASCSTRRPRS